VSPPRQRHFLYLRGSLAQVSHQLSATVELAGRNYHCRQAYSNPNTLTSPARDARADQAKVTLAQPR
jgi:hypothetical protein